MVYKSNVIEIMIVSPGDVQEERDIIEERIWVWNSRHTKYFQIILHPLRWEKDSYTEFQGSPQDSINRQVVERSDMAICVFWSKIGTPTTKYKSGSVEELQKHVENGKPAMVFFSKKDLPQGYDREQFDKLTEFKRDNSDKCLYLDFESHTQFKELLDSNLHQVVMANFKENPIIDTGFKIEKHVEAEAPNPSDLAIEILLACNETSDDSLYKKYGRQKHGYDMWYCVKAGDKEFGTEGDRKSRLRAESAVEELVEFHYLKSTVDGGNHFKITLDGYNFIDGLNGTETVEKSSKMIVGNEVLVLQRMDSAGPMTLLEEDACGHIVYVNNEKEVLTHKIMLEFKDSVKKLLDQKLVVEKEIFLTAVEINGGVIKKTLYTPTLEGYKFIEQAQDRS